MISYEDFAKLEIKIGTILSVEVVEGADKLLRLMVDVGETKDLSEEEGGGQVAVPRQILSGIREFFEDPQILVGKQCPFLVNLETRVIRGFESQGMILAASTEAGFALLHPSKELDSGARVK